ncbi:MAG: X2-like carbohydrate binding domain-containing protein [Agathobacter sp.]
MNKKRKLLSLILTICMALSLVPMVTFAEETEYYTGDGTVYVPADYEAKEISWDLYNQLKDVTIYLTQDDKLTGTSEIVTTTSGTGFHTPIWCGGSWEFECGHYGEASYDHRQYLGFRLSGDAAALENLNAPVKVYTVTVVDETVMETYGESKTRPANIMTTADYEAVETVTVLSYPTRIFYKEYGEKKESHKRCGVKNTANEYIPYDNYYYYVGGLLEVESLSINAFPVKYDLQGGTMESGKTLPSKYFITTESYVCDVNDPVRLGYTFAGWESNDNSYVYTRNGEIKTSTLGSYWWNNIEAAAETGSTLIATWDASTISISLDPNGGTIDGSSAVKNLGGIRYSETAGRDTSYFDVSPTKADSNFLGWYLGDTKIACPDDIPQSEWNSDNSYTLTAKWSDEGQKPSGTQTSYDFMEGANGSWIQNSNGTLTFRVNGDFNKFTGVKVDDTLIDAKNYTAESGSTIVSLKEEYLKTLSAGKHSLTILFNDGEGSTSFEINEDANQNEPSAPQAGDNSNLWLWVIVLFGIGALAIGAVVFSKKKMLNK